MMQGLQNSDGVKSTDLNSSDPQQKSEGTLKGVEYERCTPNPEDLDERWLRWKCLKCGFVYEGVKPVNVCPKCKNEDPDLFEDAF